MDTALRFILMALGTCFLCGCGLLGRCHEEPFGITAVRLSPGGGECEPQGIPYYLPKPLLVVAKNFRHIDESKIGTNGNVPIPGGFDNQSSFADVKANVTVPGNDGKTTDAAALTRAAVSAATQGRWTGTGFQPELMTPAGRMEDGLVPDSFFTYQIIFVPDLTQKYGLRINGGPGEVRAAMNMVNGWMYTGMGPFYLKDSSTAQNRMASGVATMFAGRAAADVLNEIGEIAQLGVPGGESGNPEFGPAENKNARTIDANKLADAVNGLAKAMERQTLVPDKMVNYAEIHIYEPELTPDGRMEWELIAEHHFDRDYFRADGNNRGEMAQILNKMLDGMNSVNPAAQKTESQPALPPEAIDLNLQLRTGPKSDQPAVWESGAVDDEGSTSQGELPKGSGFQMQSSFDDFPGSIRLAEQQQNTPPDTFRNSPNPPAFGSQPFVNVTVANQPVETATVEPRRHVSLMERLLKSNRPNIQNKQKSSFEVQQSQTP